MNIRTVTRGNSIIISLSGDFYLYNSTDLKKTLLDVIYSNYEKVMIDMGSLGYFDSSFIGALIFANNKMKARKRELTLINPSDEARTMLRIINLEKDFKIQTGQEQPALLP